MSQRHSCHQAQAWDGPICRGKTDLLPAVFPQPVGRAYCLLSVVLAQGYSQDTPAFQGTCRPTLLAYQDRHGTWPSTETPGHSSCHEPQSLEQHDSSPAPPQGLATSFIWAQRIRGMETQ